MKKRTVTVSIEGITENGYEETYDVGEQVCERFTYVCEDKRFAAVEAIDEGTKEKIAADVQVREWKNDVLVSFAMPAGGAKIAVRYNLSEGRTRLTVELGEVKKELADVPSYFYSGLEDVNGDSNDIDENKTYYYDQGDDLTFVLRLKREADVVLCLDGEEYVPEEKKEKFFNGEKIYEYTFGQTDDFDRAYRTRKRIPLRNVTEKVCFKLK